jgi:hypothetical protein
MQGNLQVRLGRRAIREKGQVNWYLARRPTSRSPATSTGFTGSAG